MLGRRRTTLRAVGAGAALLVAAAILVHGTSATQAQTERAVAAGAPGAEPEVVELLVSGLACPLCVAGLEKRLREEIQGLSDLESELESGEVTFRVEDGSGLTDERLRKVVKDAGFAVKEIERSPVD